MTLRESLNLNIQSTKMDFVVCQENHFLSGATTEQYLNTMYLRPVINHKPSPLSPIIKCSYKARLRFPIRVTPVVVETNMSTPMGAAIHTIHTIHTAVNKLSSRNFF